MVVRRADRTTYATDICPTKLTVKPRISKRLVTDERLAPASDDRKQFPYINGTK